MRRPVTLPRRWPTVGRWAPLALLLFIAACGGQQAATPAATSPTPTATAAAAAATAQPTTAVQRAATPTTASQPVLPTAAPTATAPAPTPAATATSAPTAVGTTPPPTGAAASPTGTCAPTRADSLGPFYKPDAPVRASVGQGYVLTGVVRDANGCRPLPGARVEFWLANPQGEYDDDHRATVFAGAQGEYRFESNVPVPYSGRPPHIHIRVTAPGFAPFVTQHYPQAGQTTATFDLVLAAR